MSILASEIKIYRSLTVTDTSANGGRMSTNQIVSGALANCFSHVLPDERVTGSVKYRKIFYHVGNDDDLPLLAAKVFLDAPTPGADWMTFFAGTMRDTMADHSGSPRRYGSAFLQSNAAAGASSLIVTIEDSSVAGIFAAGDEIVITDKLTPGAVSGNREFHVISGGPTVVGNQVTISLVGVLANSYTTAANARVASVLPIGDLACSVSNWAESGSGTYDETTYPILTDNLGTIEQSWTFAWLDATTFTCTGDTVGSVGSGTIGSNFAPVNPATSKPYFTLRAAGHGGTHVAGDTITCQTHPAAAAIFVRRDLPAAAASTASNRADLVLLGATA